jgi:predicted NBD/HSP70 family sugar kinase
VLNLVRSGIATTRQDIERCSELGRAVVTDRLATLAKLNLIGEGELGQSAGGRAPRHIRFRPDAGRILVSVLDRSSLAVGLSDLSGTLSSEHHEALDIGASAQDVLERVTVLFNWLLEDQQESVDVWSIGISLPGPLSPPGDVLFSAPRVQALQAWADFPFIEELSARFGAPVWAQGSAQVMTMGELKSGEGRDTRDMLFVELGRSINAGLVSNGQLHLGAHGAAGLIGHSFVERESLDSLAGADAVAAEGLAAANEDRSPYLATVLARSGDVGPADIGHGAQLGDPFCMELLARVGRLIGECLAPLVNMANPEVIVLAGSVAQTGDTLLAAVREAVYRQSHPLVTRDLRIVRSQMGNSAGLIGAAQLAAESLFDPRVLAGWITLGSPLQHPLFLEILSHARRATVKPARPEPPRIRASRRP